MDFLQAETAIAAAFSGGLTTVVARHFILKALNDLSEMIKQVQKIKESLSAIEVKLGQLERLQQTAITHDHQITEIQSRLKYERIPAFNCIDKTRMQET